MFNTIETIGKELQAAGHNLSELEKQKAMIRGLPEAFDLTAQVIQSSATSYTEAIAQLIIQEIILGNMQERNDTALVIRRFTNEKKRKC